MTNASQTLDAKLEAALEYARLGWPVFPCRGKEPATKNGCRDATTDPAIITAWWQGKYRGCNIAIATGGKVWALDVDPDDDGDASLYRLEHQHGPLPDTVRSITGGGGAHYLFKMNGTPIRNSVGKMAGIAPGLDTRGDGGYIIVPPSIHPDTKAPYQWEADFGPEDFEPVEAPAWLEDLAKRPERPERIVQEGRRREKREGPASPYGQTALDDECHAIQDAANGAQEATLNAAALKIGSLVAGGELDEDYAFNALVKACSAMPNYDPRKPWRPRQIETKLMRAMADGGRTPRKAPEPRGRKRQTTGDAEQQARTEERRTDNRKSDHDPALAERLSSFLLNDIGNAMRLIERFGESLRFVVNVGWHQWDGRRWQRDESQIEARKYAQRTAKAIFHECAVLSDHEAAKERAKFAVRSGNDSRLSAMLSVSEPHLALSAEAMDGNHWLLNCENGTLDLRTGEIRSHRHDDLLTRLAPVAYNPNAPAPTWKAFLADIFEGDKELISYVQKAVGYSLTGLTREQVLFITHGGGSNGKTTFLEVLTQMVGDHSQQTPTETFMVKDRAGGIPNDIARLKGARLVTATETESGQRLAESLVKQATGGDKLVGRFMRQEFFEFTPTFKLWLATNHKPEIRGTDTAIWRRIRLIPFNVVFKDAEEAEQGEKVKDKTLPERLSREMPGILAWAVRGCLEWQKHGLAAPPAVTKATSDYREEMDALGEFMAECIEPARSTTVAASAVRAVYVQWCESNGVDPLNANKFGRLMTERGIRRGSTTHGAKGYEGIDIKAEFKPKAERPRGYRDD